MVDMDTTCEVNSFSATDNAEAMKTECRVQWNTSRAAIIVRSPWWLLLLIYTDIQRSRHLKWQRRLAAASAVCDKPAVQPVDFSCWQGWKQAVLIPRTERENPITISWYRNWPRNFVAKTVP